MQVPQTTVVHPTVATSLAPAYATANFLVTIGSPKSHPHIAVAYSKLHSAQQRNVIPQDDTCILLVLDSESHPIAGFDAASNPSDPAQLIASHFCYHLEHSELPALLARAIWHVLSIQNVDSIAVETSSAGIAEQVRDLYRNILKASDDKSSFPVISKRSFFDLPSSVKKTILLEQAYLSPPLSCSDTPHPHQIVFDHPYHADYLDLLNQKAIVNVSIFDCMLAEASGCGYGSQVDNCPLWHNPFVYLPWRNALTRILVPDLFHKVRLDRNRYKLTLSEMEALREKTVGVIGLSVGASIAYCLVQQGLCGHIRLADFDSLELSNLNRLDSSFINIGTHKADIARQRIAEIDPYLPVTIFKEGVAAENAESFARGLSVIVEECDSMDVKLLIRQHARELGIPVVMETNDNGILDVERYDLHEGLLPFHGLLGNVSAMKLANLTTEQKLGTFARFLDFENMSTRMSSSALEIGSTISSWPQLAEDVALGTSLVTCACRRILLGFSAPSGRSSTSVNSIVSGIHPVQQRPFRKAPLKKRMPLPEDDIEAIERAAHLAPSGGNAQPWKIEVNEAVVKVSLRDDAASTIIDWNWCGSLVGCGAALCNAWCVAAGRARVQHSDELCIDFDEGDLKMSKLCGQFQLGRSLGILGDLADIVIHRVSNRRNVAPKELQISVINTLQNTVKPFGVRFVYVPAADIDADIIGPFAQGNRVRFFCEQTHKELFHELRDPDSDSLSEGLDLRTFELSEVDKAAIQLLRNYENVRLLRDWDLGQRLSELSTKTLKGCDGIIFLIINGNAKRDYVRAGFALEAALLRAVQLKLGINIIWPLFGGGHSHQELCAMTGDLYGKELIKAKETLEKRLGVTSTESFLCCIRLLQGEGPSAISQRYVPT